MSSPGTATATTVELISGGDPVVVARMVGEAIRRLAGGENATAVTELREEDYTAAGAEPDLSRVTDAAQTPPMLSDFRVVVARHLGVFGAAGLAPLIGYLEAPLATTRLLLVWEKGAAQAQLRPLPGALRDAVEAAGGVRRSAAIGSGKQARAWLAEQLAASAVTLDRAGADLLAEHIGEDRAGVWAILDTLEGAYGPGARLGATDVAPFLGERGTVPPWELTDAIAKGDIAGSLACLQRLCGPEAMHPMQVLAILRSHFDRIAHLEGSGARDEAAAAGVLREAGLMRKGGSTFMARKALGVARGLGHERLRRAVALLAAADLDMRGRSAQEPEAVLEVLVARLSQLHRR